MVQPINFTEEPEDFKSSMTAPPVRNLSGYNKWLGILVNYQSIPTCFAVLFCATLVGSNPVHALAEQLQGPSTLPGEECKVKHLGEWSSQERWVWNQVCEGKIADFNTVKKHRSTLDPRKLEGWSEKHVLSSQFLETILLYEPFRSALPRYGVRIIGAWFQKPLDLHNATLAHPLMLGKCRFEGSVRLDSLKTPDLLLLSGSKFTGPLNMEVLRVGSSLFMRDGAEFADVDLRGAKIDLQFNMEGSKFAGFLNMNTVQVGGSLHMEGAEISTANLGSAKIDDQLIMNRSKFIGPLNMGGLHVGTSLFMEGARFADVDLHGAMINQVLTMNRSEFTGPLILDSLRVGDSLHMGEARFVEVNLRGAKIDQVLTMNGSKFTGPLIMDSLQVKGSLIMRDGAEFAEVDLRNAKIDNTLDLTNSKLTASVIMEHLQVGNNLLLRGVEVKKEGPPLNLIFAEIGSTLFIEDSTLPSLDLTGIKIRAAFSLGRSGHTSLKWHPDSQLILRNTEVGAVQDLAEVWPEKLELNGFTYDRLGVLDNPFDRDTAWYIDWLARQVKYSPQPYEQLASVLRKAGHSDKADEILYAGRNRGLKNASGLLEWAWLFSLKVLIGYGYRIYYSSYWFIGFVGLGTLVLWVTGQGQSNKMPYGFSYSLDMLLPIVRLRERHNEIDLSGFARYYFYVHKVMGYVLVSFLLAGLAGLTK
jgi:uncharacterized protein YjbI with pentapeptide repeats